MLPITGRQTALWWFSNVEVKMYLCVLFISFFFMSFFFLSLSLSTLLTLSFFTLIIFLYFPHISFVRFFCSWPIYFFRSFCLTCYSTSFLSVLFLRIQILWCVTLCRWSAGPIILLYPNAANQSPRHKVATMNTSNLRNTTLRTSISSLCFNTCFFVSCLLFSFWKQHLFWEINVKFNAIHILSEVPKIKIVPFISSPTTAAVLHIKPETHRQILWHLPRSVTH